MEASPICDNDAKVELVPEIFQPVVVITRLSTVYLYKNLKGVSLSSDQKI